ncbi:MAG: glycoside hydrolase family 78 protein [Gemmatimonadota bacterium]|nr:MAG: glycoside hydrolase family 78 protein [Gemmatimonadota bacterium]
MATHAVAPVGESRAPVSLTYLRCEYKVDPLGIDVRQPRLSWQLTADGRGVVQAAYQVRVAESEAGLAASPIWDTGRIDSDQSIHVVYEGPALASGRRYYWQVRIRDGDGEGSDWSSPAFWEMGLLDATDWQASWISPAWEEDLTAPQPVPMLRTTFTVDGEVQAARAYVTSLGLYEVEFNGQRVGDQVFTPGWTSYDTRLQYQTYDVTGLLQSGDNAVGAMLGDGWYRGYLGWSDRRNIYGENLALLLQLQISYTDGRVRIVGSDASWKANTGPIRMSDLYNGEHYDARLEKPGWSSPGYDDSNWAGVRLIDHPKDILIAPAGPPVRKIEEITPVAVLHTPAGETVFDMGQNMVGWVRLRVNGATGTTVTLRHAEVLDKEGNLYTENLRSAAQTIRYTLKGGGEEVYEPRFTFQGFRYVAVDGWPGEPTVEALTGVVIHSAMTPTGSFEASKPLINQLQHNIVWGQKGNFLDVPTDCPQRDERMGWTGDAQVFARTAAFNTDVAGFFTKWLGDLAADQKPSGSIPFVIPDVLTRGSPGGGGATGWADAGVVIPWTLYLVYGDTRILEAQYESMKAWVGYMQDRAGDDLIWAGDFHFGDWLAYATDRSDYPGATTDKDLIATAYFAYSTSLLQKMATVLGNDDDAARYAALLEDVKEAFREEFITANGRMASNTQTAYALALSFGLMPEGQEAQAAQRLAQDVRAFGNHITTGFLGTPLLCHSLSDNGYLDVAYDLLNQDTYPSWLYPVKMGATTIWERWDGIKPDSTFQDAGMNSLNHYAYGAIGEWLYRVVAGLETDPAEPGYKHVRIQPQPGGGFTYARAALNTMYGPTASAWELSNGQFQLDVTVPPNTHATIRLPHATLAQVTESGQGLDDADGIARASQEGDVVIVEVGSGQYRFAYDTGELE